MHTTKSSFACIAVAVLLLQVNACRKPAVYVDKEESEIESIPPNHYSLCRISKFVIREEHPSLFRNGFVSYNSRGNPTAIRFDTCWLYHPQIEFRYDVQGRLTDYLTPLSGCPYAGGVVEVWHRYLYNSSDRIIADTMIYWVERPGDVPIFNPHVGYRYYITYEYDTQNRIIAVNKRNITWPTSTDISRDEYVYNTNGNRAWRINYYNGIRGEIELYGSYDNKVSFLRTNKLWQFLAQDYSVNNRIGATSYNSYNLPTKFRLDSYFDRDLLYGMHLDRADISYSCRTLSNTTH